MARVSPKSMSAHLMSVNDLVISRSGTCGIAAVFPGWGAPVVPGAFLIRFRLKQPRSAAFYRRYFNSQLGRPRLDRLAVGGVQKNIKGSSVLALLVPVLSETESEAIRVAINDADRRLAIERSEQVKLKTLKRGLMDDLLTGRVRVTVPDEAAT